MKKILFESAIIISQFGITKNIFTDDYMINTLIFYFISLLLRAETRTTIFKVNQRKTKKQFTLKTNDFKTTLIKIYNFLLDFNVRKMEVYILAKKCNPSLLSLRILPFKIRVLTRILLLIVISLSILESS